MSFKNHEYGNTTAEFQFFVRNYHVMRLMLYNYLILR